MAQTIEGKVAKILSDTHLVVNLGAMHGIRVGAVFVILAEGDEVKDPDTGEALGRWEVTKGRVVATNVQQRLTTCEALAAAAEKPTEVDPTRRVLSAEMIEVAMGGLSGHGKAKLNVDQQDVSGMPRIGPIRVGDKVRAEIDL